MQPPCVICWMASLLTLFPGGLLHCEGLFQVSVFVCLVRWLLAPIVGTHGECELKGEDVL